MPYGKGLDQNRKKPLGGSRGRARSWSREKKGGPTYDVPRTEDAWPAGGEAFKHREVGGKAYLRREKKKGEKLSGRGRKPVFSTMEGGKKAEVELGKRGRSTDGPKKLASKEGSWLVHCIVAGGEKLP